MNPIKNESDIFPQTILEEVRAYATNGFSPEHIADVIGIDNVSKQLFIEKVYDPSDELYYAYQGGLMAGQHTVRMALKTKADTGEPEAVKTFMQAVNDEQTVELRKILFGV